MKSNRRSRSAWIVAGLALILSIAIARAILAQTASGDKGQEDLTIRIHVVWTNEATTNFSQDRSSGKVNDTITVIYDGTAHAKAPAGTHPWDMTSGDMNEHLTVNGGGSGTATSTDQQGATRNYAQSWDWQLKGQPQNLGGGISMGPSGVFELNFPSLQGVKIEPQMQAQPQAADLRGAVEGSIAALMLSPQAQPGGVMIPARQPPFFNSAEETASHQFWDQLSGTFDPNAKSFSRSGSGMTSGQSTNQTTPGVTSTSNGSVKVFFTLHFNQQPEDVEAILIPPDQYDQWMPEASSDEDTPGNGMPVRVVLQKKDQPGKKPQAKAKAFKFELAGVSKEPGVCLNWPPKDKVKQPPDFDLKIDKSANPGMQVAADGQSATSGSDLQESSVIIFSYDWGGWGSLRVTAELDNGQTVVAHLKKQPSVSELKIPKDDNDNHVADVWELKGEATDAEADEDPLPKGDHTGDTLSYYEEYRGFHVSGDHVRTDNNRKDVFVYDRDQLGLGNFPASGMNIHVLQRDEYTKVDVGDPLHENSRVVNFNHDFAHLGDAHVLMLLNGAAPEGPGREGVALGGPGPPKKIIAVYVDRYLCLASKWGNLELQNTIGHELAHGCNVPHHGDLDYVPDDIWKKGPDGKWYPMGAPAGRDVAAQDGQHSGAQCVMRYFRAAFYEHAGGQFRWKHPTTGGWTEGERYGPSEIPGTTFCTSQDGATPNSKTGPADAGRGKCSERFCVNDLKH